jgi:uncharacterized membrane protein YsdA (DUF1294 family)
MYTDFFIIFLIIINIITFIASGLDKKAAINYKRRVPEKHLWILAVVGGSVGLYLSMKVFRHKTKHWNFKYGIPVLIFVQIMGMYILTVR